jgi:Ca2+:H+ antiporter
MGKSFFASATDSLNVGKPRDTGGQDHDGEKIRDSATASADTHRAQTALAYNNHGSGKTISSIAAHFRPDPVKDTIIEKSDDTNSPASQNVQTTRNQSPAVGTTETPPPKTPLSKRLVDAFWRFCRHTKNALTHSWLNVLLVLVPIGIAAELAHLPPAAIFAINAVAVIPLAGLLTHATETVALQLGDTLGALLNVSFGNAVELIIFIIALVKNEIRIVQASVLGSILANLLLILGMAFAFGGLRYREQVSFNIQRKRR